jgi:hypothetical protein
LGAGSSVVGTRWTRGRRRYDRHAA